MSDVTVSNIVFINGVKVPKGNAKLSVFTRTLLFGEGLFETALIQNGIPVFLKEHLDRLWASCQAYGWKIGPVEARIKDLNRCVKQAKVPRGRLRILCLPKGDPGDLLYSEHRGYDWVYYITPENEPSSLKPITLKTISDDSRSNWHYHKTVNYFESAHALREAKKEGFDDIVFIYRNRHLVECAFSNIFFIRKKTLYTPSLEIPLLNGVTRVKILEIARKMNLRVREKRIHRDWLPFFDGCFVTSSVRGIVKVSGIDRVKYLKKLPLLETLSSEYQKLLISA